MTPLNNLLCNRFGQVPAPSRPRSPTRTTVSEPLGAVAPVAPRWGSCSAAPGPAGGRAESSAAPLSLRYALSPSAALLLLVQ